jgi:hypothetical protein
MVLERKKLEAQYGSGYHFPTWPRYWIAQGNTN